MLKIYNTGHYIFKYLSKKISIFNYNMHFCIENVQSLEQIWMSCFQIFK